MHPRYGLTYPDHFIPRLESLGWIDELGIILMNHGFSDLGHFADAEEILPSLSLNIPATSICDVTFPDTILLSADKFGVPSANITIEITESGLIEELSKTLYVLTKLRLRNIQLSIDDFGTGYSTMKQLHLVPATELKIDKGFIQTMHLNKGKQVMVRKIIELGHELQMRVVAEGVETPEQLNFLRSSGCDIVQGYLFCRPLPRIVLLKWLIRYRSQHHR
jgi:EAL domain-containing protein (putative c-di-GMP-specific phosphodiesterase class I)